MSCIDVIAKKRDGFTLSREDLDGFVHDDDRGLGEASALAHAAIRLTAEPVVQGPLVLGTVAQLGCRN